MPLPLRYIPPLMTLLPRYVNQSNTAGLRQPKALTAIEANSAILAHLHLAVQEEPELRTIAAAMISRAVAPLVPRARDPLLRRALLPTSNITPAVKTAGVASDNNLIAVGFHTPSGTATHTFPISILLTRE